eukprot:COSAG02_NODE_33739_length_495_cov_1.017677_1_plen_103_part_10
MLPNVTFGDLNLPWDEENLEFDQTLGHAGAERDEFCYERIVSDDKADAAFQTAAHGTIADQKKSTLDGRQRDTGSDTNQAAALVAGSDDATGNRGETGNHQPA